MYVTSTDFRQNIGKYLDLCAKEDVYIMKHGDVFAKLSGTVNGKKESLRKISGSLSIDSKEFTEEGTETL
ncbi:MAG: type II toxin-antitoxin system Phd/YefM family antitoxin [Candidatus Methanogranum gryphiswaldense]|nr:MAG: type II toxin-antitoxin system Phd/YefM family antitoxin [Candidatus Methanogranum sp. U3.2.1]